MAVVDVFVNMQLKTVEGASNSVHRLSVGLSCFATETGSHSANCAEATAQFLEVLDMPVVVQRQVLGGRACDHAG